MDARGHMSRKTIMNINLYAFSHGAVMDLPVSWKVMTHAPMMHLRAAAWAFLIPPAGLRSSSSIKDHHRQFRFIQNS